MRSAYFSSPVLASTQYSVPLSPARYTRPSTTSGDDTSGVLLGRRHCSDLLPAITRPLASGLTPTTGPFLADGTTIRSGVATGEATKRSVRLYLSLGFRPPTRQISLPSLRRCAIE